MYALEKIDSRLPGKIQKDFGHRMQGNITLIDLAGEIFQSVPSLIEEIEQVADFKALSVKSDQVVLNASFLPSRGKGNRGRGRGRVTGGFLRQTPQRAPGKFCRICHMAGKDRAQVTSHHIGSCRELSSRDKQDFAASLKFVSINDEEEEEEDSYLPEEEDNCEDAPQ